MKILVTGGAGYIGSHTTLTLLSADYDVVVYDNFYNASKVSLERIAALTGKVPCLEEGDVCDAARLTDVFSSHAIDAVIHFAALKAVGESVQIPLKYYQNNVHGTLTLLETMQHHGVHRFIFSSSATVYGETANAPYKETLPLGQPASPYGTSKVMVEQIMQDLAKASADFRGVSLRYFNPVGAHESGTMGEDPKGIPNNLLPYIAQVAVGRRNKLAVFGNDYPTPDGTCQRDYVHVMDLAEGHMAALNWLLGSSAFRGVETFNLGRGEGVSVLEIIQAFEAASGVTIPYDIAPRRSGDLPAFWADATKASAVLKWQAKRSLKTMMEDTWRWQSSHPNGYEPNECFEVQK